MWILDICLGTEVIVSKNSPSIFISTLLIITKVWNRKYPTKCEYIEKICDVHNDTIKTFKIRKLCHQDRTGGCYINWNTPGPKPQTLYVFTYISNLSKSISIINGGDNMQGTWEKVKERFCSKGTEFQLGWTNKFWWLLPCLVTAINKNGLFSKVISSGLSYNAKDHLLCKLGSPKA
jgi:hypothetical protein